jgi:hypothetical protein
MNASSGKGTNPRGFHPEWYEISREKAILIGICITC